MPHNKNLFINDFQEELNKVGNPKYLIQNEITQIEVFTSTKQESSDRNFFGSGSNKTNSVFDLSYMGSRKRFNEVFVQHLLNGEVELSQGEVDFPHFKQFHETAKQFGEYYLWLKDLQNIEKDKSKTKPTLTHKQKILALHYFGFDLSKYDNIKTAKILSQILNVSEENTRKYLSYVSAGKNDVRTKQNLEKVSQLFENIGVIDISNKIKSDLDK